MARQAVHNFMPQSLPSMSQATDAELADALDAMYQQSTMSFPNPVHEEIKRRGKSFLESKDVLCILKAEAGRDAVYFEQGVLETLEHAATIKTLRLEPVIDGDENSAFDFAGFCELVTRFLTNLQSMSITHMRIRNFDLQHVATINSIELTDPQMQDRVWNLELPNLRSLTMQNHTPPDSAFAQSLIQCPRIEEYFSHKCWMDEMPNLYLPNCKCFTWRRGDCTEKMSLYVPRLEELNLDASYDLKQLTLLKQGHASHKEWNLPRGVSHSKFNVSCQNAILSKKVKKSLIESGRLKNAIQEEEDDSDMGIDAFQRHMHKCMEDASKTGGIEGLLKGIEAASSGWHDKLKPGNFDDDALASMDGEDDWEEEDEEEEEEDYEDSDDDGPTVRNPWGRDGDALRGGVVAFEKIVDRMVESQGHSFVDACAVRDEDGFNAVHHCAFQGYDETLAFILKKSENEAGLPGLLKAPVITGEAPLHLAVQYKREQCIELLLEAGSNLKAKDRYGKTVLDYVTSPADCTACYQIVLDNDFQKRMLMRFKQVESLRKPAKLYRIDGLTSEAGRPMNGQTCQFMSVDKGTGRYIVRLNAEDPQPAWKKLKPENLKDIPATWASSEGYPVSAERC